MKKAFSLIELAIVLTAIALLTISVTTASKLTHYAELNKLTTEIQELHNSYKLFTLKYEARPGDFTKAEDFWGSSDVDNGDGDGRVEWTDESYNASLHLVKAKLIANRNYKDAKPGYEFRFDSIAQVKGKFMHNLQTNGTSFDGFNYLSKDTNTLSLGADENALTAVFIPKDLHYIDKKIDDGQARSGKIIYRIISGVTDSTCTGSGTTYDLTITTPGCNMVYDVE